MRRVILEEETHRGPEALSPARPGSIQLLCDSCGLEWVSAHHQEECPLRELERVFLPEDWFMVSSEATS